MMSPASAPFMLLGVLLLVMALVAACATPIPGASPDLLTFLRPGETSRQDVVLRLGQPSASFERERILTYRLGQDSKQGYYVVTPAQVVPVEAGGWHWVRYSLVLIFDEQGVLSKQSLVPVQ